MEAEKLLERIVVFKKKSIKNVDWLQSTFDRFSEGKHVAF
jgi:hypothetical protein